MVMMVNETSSLSAANKPTDHGDLVAYPADALVRIHAAQPPLSTEQAHQITTGIAKLFQHFAREGRCERGQAQVIEGGTVMVIAWIGPLLSGCSHDKLNGLLAHGEREGIDLLTTPPISVCGNSGWRHGTRANVRAWIADGSLSASARYLDRTVATMGAWRERGILPLSASPLRGLLSSC